VQPRNEFLSFQHSLNNPRLQPSEKEQTISQINEVDLQGPSYLQENKLKGEEDGVILADEAKGSSKSPTVDVIQEHEKQNVQDALFEIYDLANLEVRGSRDSQGSLPRTAGPTQESLDHAKSLHDQRSSLDNSKVGVKAAEIALPYEQIDAK